MIILRIDLPLNRIHNKVRATAYTFMKTFLFVLFSFCLTFLSTGQQKKEITLNDVWKNPIWRTKGIDDLNWMKNGDHYSVLKGSEIVVFSIATGEKVKTLLSSANLNWNGNKIEIENYKLSPDENQILIETDIEPIYRRSSKATFFLYNLQTASLKPLAEGRKIYLADFSPDSKKIAYGFDNNLYVYDLASQKELAVTSTGKKNELIHGSSDWVYEEEFEFWKAFQWSPDSKKIAFLSFLEKDVPTYNMQMWTGLYPQDYNFKYPKAGEKNARVDVSIYDLNSGQTLEIEEGAAQDQYIARMQWANSNILSLKRLNRLQNKLELLHVEAQNGLVRTILTQTSKEYVEVTDDLIYLKNGSGFVFGSDESGFQHLYFCAMDGSNKRAITTGNWEVTQLNGIDEQKKLVYYTGTENGSIERQVYVISLDGKGKKRLTNETGTHSATFNPTFSFFVDQYHASGQPSNFTLCKANGKAVRVIEDNKDAKRLLLDYDLAPKTFFEIEIEPGLKLNAWMIKPTNFNPQNKYPVLMHCYGGPGHQTVTNAWSGPDFFWYQMLASKGYIIVSVDNRGTGGKGAAFKKATYGKLGKLECEDQIAAARYLAKQPYVNASRIGIWGWSFGGYLTSLCMTKGADVFTAGIAVAPVTNWRFYDSIYTERYLGLPSENPDGYDQNSPVTFAANLKGKYLLVHGTGDDNVHFQNAVSMVNALVKANKQFDSFYYPDRNHGIYGGNTRFHLYEMMTRFLVNHL